MDQMTLPQSGLAAQDGAVQALRRAGMGRGEILKAFLTSGHDFLPALALRFLETQRLLPRWLQSRADMG